MDKRYNSEEIEKEIQGFWEKTRPYAFCEESNKEVFSIDTPPPTVSGSLHVGHICSYTQTDLVARFKRMQGYNVFYPMGFDDNGLPTEKFVEKKHKVRAHNLKRSEFIELCLKESVEMAKVFSELWKKVGLSIDWEKTYSTISESSRRISQLSFIELFKKNLVYKKEDPALYCTTCRTTVAQAELDDVEVKSTFNDIVFKSEDGKELVVGTTRPELLPACVALFFHPDDSRYKDLNGTFALSPVFNKKIPIMPDDSVDIEKGTGLVMCCTFGDQTDVFWYKKHGLKAIQIIGRDGKWNEHTGPLEGLRVHDARKKILELLEEGGLLKTRKDISHAVNVHERCKKEIEYLILSQWFVKILDNKEKFLSIADDINWNPSFMKARYKDWVDNLGWDWCISRQRFYGVQFPLWYCMDCGNIILADEKDLPVDPQEQECPHKSCPECSGTKIVPETDIMDTWNTSSLTPQINTKWPKSSKNLKLPMSLRPQAHDIIRTWTFYTIVKSVFHENKMPWKNIAVSGYVVAKGKEKISKSRGNAPTDPEQLLKSYPADAIRYWAANGRLGVDTVFSEEQFKIGRRLLTKLWNAFRFCKDHIEDYKKEDKVELDVLNDWLYQKFSETVDRYIKYFENYEHTNALETIEKFFWQIFCDNYLELVKDRIFNPDDYDSTTMSATRHTMYNVGFGILQLFAPFVPHVTEKLFQLLFKEKEDCSSLHITKLDESRFKTNKSDVKNMVDSLVEVVSIARKLKSEQKLSLKVEVEELCLHSSDKKLLDFMKAQEKIISGVTKAKKVSYSSETIDKEEIENRDEKWFMRVGI